MTELEVLAKDCIENHTHLLVGNLLGVFYFATKGDNIGLELINLVSLYVCWKELKNV